jgi:hypothetical protein
MNLAEYLQQGTVTLTAGDYLAANTEAVGYLPTHKTTVGLKSGRYLFKIVDGGGVGKFNIIPVVEADDNASYVEKTDEPVVVVEPTKITYTTTRNDSDYKDVYRTVKTHVVEGIADGEEARHALNAFIAFTDSEYSLGVQHFQVVGADYLDETV